MTRPSGRPPAPHPMFPVPHAVATSDDVRGGPDDPVVRRRAWLDSHPGGTIGRPEPDQLRLVAAVDGVVVESAYADLEVLMNKVRRVGAEGRCPLHPSGCPS